jgi:hypothetical protein
MSRALCATLAIVLSLSNAGSQAKMRDGDQLLRQCTATIGAHVNFCFGYIDAIVDLLVENNGIDGFNACISTELDDPELRNIVVKFLKDNPDLRHLGAPDLIARALAAAFPCR